MICFMSKKKKKKKKKKNGKEAYKGTLTDPPEDTIPFHYENTPIQIYRKFNLQKLKIFR